MVPMYRDQLIAHAGEAEGGAGYCIIRFLMLGRSKISDAVFIMKTTRIECGDVGFSVTVLKSDKVLFLTIRMSFLT